MKRTPMSSQIMSALILCIRCWNSCASDMDAHTGTTSKLIASSLGKNLHDLQDISFRNSFSTVRTPSCANIFLFGFLPTGSRLATLETRKPREKRTRGCITCTSKDDEGQSAKSTLTIPDSPKALSAPPSSISCNFFIRLCALVLSPT